MKHKMIKLFVLTVVLLSVLSLFVSCTDDLTEGCDCTKTGYNTRTRETFEMTDEYLYCEDDGRTGTDTKPVYYTIKDGVVTTHVEVIYWEIKCK